jgi:hypothetical protein
MPNERAPLLPKWGDTKALGQPPLEPPPESEPKKETQNGSKSLPWWYQ